jgi:Ca-activated chloride channel family protein
VNADHAAVLTAMQELGPELIPLPGTNIAGALRCAEEAFDHSEGGQRALVLITDGEELEEDAVAIAQELSAKMRIFTVGVGSPEGAVLAVPAQQGGGIEYVKDAAGNVVQSKLDEGRLRQIAQAGGGFYTRLLSGPAEMRKVALEGIALMDEHEVQLEGRSVAIERYQWPLGAAMLLIAAGFLMSEGVRRRALAVLAFGLLWSGLGSATAASAATANATNAPANASSGATNPAVRVWAEISAVWARPAARAGAPLPRAAAAAARGAASRDTGGRACITRR